MGCDGGTIPKRDELVRTKKKQEAVRSLELIPCVDFFIIILSIVSQRG